MLYTRLVLLLSDVICVFADDLGGPAQAAKYLKRWIKLGNTSTVSKKVRSRIVFVVSHDAESFFEDIVDSYDSSVQFDQGDDIRCEEIFQSVSWMRMPSAQLFLMAAYRGLKDILLAQIDLSRGARIETRLMFSAVHLRTFYTLAVRTLHHGDNTFDFLESSRSSNKIGPDYRQHLQEFLKLGFDLYMSRNDLSEFVASSILMDAYPSRMHRNIILVFAWN